MPQQRADVGTFGDDRLGHLEPGTDVGTRQFWPIRPGDTIFFPLEVVADRIGVPAYWMLKEAEANRVPYLDVGDRWLFNPYAVARALLDRERQERAKEQADYFLAKGGGSPEKA